MKDNRVKFFLGLCSMGGALIGSNYAHADLHARSMIGMGVGSTQFSQSDDVGHATEVSSKNTIGINAQFGIGFSRFFAEYTLYWQMPSYSPPLREKDAGYMSLFGANVGVALDPIPVEVYAGLEKGVYSLHAVDGADFEGLATKLGVAAYLIGGAPGSYKVGGRAEYRRHSVGSDGSGSVPSSVSTSVNVFWVGVTIGTG